jgi:TonB family protein
MNNSWKEWQGRTVDGKYVLGTYLGGSEGSAVFRTRVGSELFSGAAIGNREAEAEPGLKTDAAIKLLVADGAEAESPLRRWQEAGKLTHPNLIRILAAGRAAVEGRELVYAVEEFAEENLAQILPERALAPEEARGMMGPVLSALEFVHKQGLVHGAVRPSNIMAAADQVKLSSDNLRPAGEVPRAISLYDAPEVLISGISPASDAWSLGMTLVEVLTQHPPAWDPARMSPPEVGPDVPQPFREIAQRCLVLDPARRCGLGEIADRLRTDQLEPRPEDRPGVRREGKTAPAAAAAAGRRNPTSIGAIAASQKKTAKGPYLVVLAAAIAIIIFLMVRPRPSSTPDESPASASSPQTPSSQPTSSQPSAPAVSSSQTAPPASSSPAREATPAKQPPAHAPSSDAERNGEQRAAATDEIVERAMPQVSPSARRTISGKIKVRVRVDVDAAGNVTEAKLKTPGPSKYFARLSLEAARRWKFAPAPDVDRRAWTLLFSFTRAHTEASASPAH